MREIRSVTAKPCKTTPKELSCQEDGIECTHVMEEVYQNLSALTCSTKECIAEGHARLEMVWCLAMLEGRWN